MTNNNEQMAALRTKIADVLEYNIGSDMSDQGHTELIDDMLELFTTTTAEAVREARIDECEQAITEYNRFQEYYSAGNKDLQFGNKFLLNRLAQLTNTKDAV